MDRKTKSIELFGVKLLLSERTAGDLIALMKYDKSNKNDNQIEEALYQAVQDVADGLKINYESVKWDNFRSKKYKKLLSTKNLINKLSQQQIFQLAEQVLELDGL